MTATPAPPPPPPARGRRGLGLSARVGLVAGGAAAMAVILTSTLIYLTTARTLRSEVDRDLVTIASSDDQGDRFRPGPRQDPFGGRAGFVQLLTPDGEALATSGVRLPVTDVARALAGGDQSRGRDGRVFETRRLEDSDTVVRILTVGLDQSLEFQGRAIGGLQIALPMDDVLASLASLRRALLIGGLAFTLLAGAGGRWVGRRTVRPVLDLTTVAEEVRVTGDLTRRLDVVGEDEVAGLARTFNAMLASLERIQDSQTRLVADASHELRTPLTSLRTNIEVLDDFERLDLGDRHDLLRDVRFQLQEFGHLIDSLVALARDARADRVFTDVRLDDVVAEVADSVRPFVPAGRALVVETAPVTVRGDEDALARSVRNLLDNAVKYGHEDIEVSVTPDGTVAVRDHGPGVAEAHRTRIFDRFHRAPEARDAPGSGLGLAIVAQAASQHGGSVEVADAPGGGAVFRLHLPTTT